MDNQYIIAFLFWPVVVLLCAGLNMLVTRTFSWSELIFDYFIGVLSGWFLFAGTVANPHPADTFFFIFSHGLFGALWWAADSFREAFSEPKTFFLTMAFIRLGAVFWCSLLDKVAVRWGATWAPKPVYFSLFLLLPIKASFAWFTGAIGWLIWLVGAFNAKFGKGMAGLAGGVFWDEFKPGKGSFKATTLGFTVNTWLGDTPFEHELYHSRQYIYMSDWLVPFWCLGILWGLISAAATGTPITRRVAFAADSSKEIGNPIEVAAYHI